MTIQIELWALITFLCGLLITFLGAAFTVGRILLRQFEARLDARFKAQEQARELHSAHWDTRFGVLEKAAHEEAGQWRRVERELMELKTELPLNYVRREDYIRGQSVIEAKLDGLALRIENQSLRGVKQ
jgi:hypothetical protein